MSQEQNDVESSYLVYRMCIASGARSAILRSGSKLPDLTKPKFGANITPIKGHRQRISTVGYKTIFRNINTEETFLPFTVITNKDYFSRKLNFRNLLSRYM